MTTQTLNASVKNVNKIEKPDSRKCYIIEVYDENNKLVDTIGIKGNHIWEHTMSSWWTQHVIEDIRKDKTYPDSYQLIKKPV